MPASQTGYTHLHPVLAQHARVHEGALIPQSPVQRGRVQDVPAVYKGRMS